MYCNKVLPLTICEFIDFEQEYKRDPVPIYQGCFSYELINIVARVESIDMTEFILNDTTGRIKVSMTVALKNMTQLQSKRQLYFSFNFVPKKYFAHEKDKDNNLKSIVGFQVFSVKPTHPNKITIHIVDCLLERQSREKFKIQQEGKKKLINPQSMEDQIAQTRFSREVMADVEQWCKMKGQFQEAELFENFKKKYHSDLIKGVLSKLLSSREPQLMDCGNIFEWIGE